MEERRTLRTRGETIEEYRREFPGETVLSYTRPLPASMLPPPAETPARPKRRRWKRGLCLLLAAAVGITAVLVGGRWLLSRIVWVPPYAREWYEEAYEWERMEDEDAPISIPQTKADPAARLEITAERTAALTAPEVYEKLSDAVVTVAVELGDGRMSVGTGIIFREDGYFVTNHHVVSGGAACTVLLADGTPYEAQFIASDADCDLAVLKIDGTGFPVAAFGDSDTLAVGEKVYAIGTPLNLDMGGTFTDGIISSLDREMQLTENTSMPLLQTNAALNSGNSGGPLINESGQVIGINFMKLYDRTSTVEGLGFAIPSVRVERMVNDLLVYGALRPEPLLGLSVMQAPDKLAEHLWGVRVDSVTPGGAADRAGVRAGDYLLAADGQELFSSTDVLKARWKHYVGDEMTLTLWRDGEILTVTLQLTDAVG